MSKDKNVKNVTGFVVVLICMLVYFLIPNCDSDKNTQAKSKNTNATVNRGDQDLINYLSHFLLNGAELIEDSVCITKSNDFGNMHFIGAIVYIDGLIHFSIWAIAGEDMSGPMLSANADALSVSGIIRGKISSFDDGYLRIMKYLNNYDN